MEYLGKFADRHEHQLHLRELSNQESYAHCFSDPLKRSIKLREQTKLYGKVEKIERGFIHG